METKGSTRSGAAASSASCVKFAYSEWIMSGGSATVIVSLIRSFAAFSQNHPFFARKKPSPAMRATSKMPERPCHIASIKYLLGHSYWSTALRGPAECRDRICCDPHSSHYTTSEKQIMPVMGKRSNARDNGKLPLMHTASQNAANPM